MLRTLTFADLESGLWGAAWELGDGQPGFVLVGDSGGLVTAEANLADLEVSPCSERSELGDGFDELVAVNGRLAANGAEREIGCLGRRGAREALDPMACESVRDVAAWFAPDDGLALIAARAAGAKGHEDDLVTVSALQAGHVLAIEEPRLSTTYDGVGAPARAGMELWPEHEDDGDGDGDEEEKHPVIHPIRATGEAASGVASTTAGSLLIEARMFRWHARGVEGAGVYVLARAR